MVRLALLCYIMYAWGTVEWQLCNEYENQSLLWGAKKPFSLNWCPGAFILLIARVGRSCESGLLTVWRMQWEAARCWRRLSGDCTQWLWSCRIRIRTEAVLLDYVACAVFLSSSHLSVLVFIFIILFGVESTGVCAKLFLLVGQGAKLHLFPMLRI